MKTSDSFRTGPRLCFVGSMVGRNPGHITQQGQILSDLFAEAGYAVTSASAFLNRYRRLLDMVGTLTRYRNSTDILILEVYGGPSFVVEDIVSRLGQQFGHRIVMWLHGGALPEFMARFPQWTRRVLSRANAIVTPSEFLSRAVARHGFEAHVIPNVINLPAYPYRHREAVRPRLFWMRNFHPIWNPNMAVRVLARLCTSLPDATLVMAGPDKGMMPQVKRFAESLGLADRVRFTGFLDMAGKVREAKCADIYVNTNSVDNAPVAVIEACAMGLPVVTTSVGGIPDLLAHGKTALLVGDNDDEAMARSVQSLIQNSELAALLSRNGRQLARRFAWDEVRNQWQQLFADLMNRQARFKTRNVSPGAAARGSNTEVPETF